MSDDQENAMPSESELFERIVAILKPLAKTEVEITADTVLIDDLSLDSLEIMEVILEIEDAYDISVPINILPDIRTVNDVVLQIRKILQEGA